MVEVKIKKIHPDAVMPSYAKPGDAGMDIVAVGKEVTDKYIEYQTGLCLEIPEGHVCLIFPRSSISKKDLMLCNSVGVLDSGYRGELVFRFQKFGEDVYKVGERVGQIVIMPYPKVNVEEVSELEESERGEGGFGSTGN
jgi:dUTP pyrophosphatase